MRKTVFILQFSALIGDSISSYIPIMQGFYKKKSSGDKEKFRDWKRSIKMGLETLTEFLFN